MTTVLTALMNGSFFTADLTLCRLTDIIIAMEEEIT